MNRRLGISPRPCWHCWRGTSQSERHLGEAMWQHETAAALYGLSRLEVRRAVTTIVRAIQGQWMRKRQGSSVADVQTRRQMAWGSLSKHFEALGLDGLDSGLPAAGLGRALIALLMRIWITSCADFEAFRRERKRESNVFHDY